MGNAWRCPSTGPYGPGYIFFLVSYYLFLVFSSFPRFLFSFLVTSAPLLLCFYISPVFPFSLLTFFFLFFLFLVTVTCLIFSFLSLVRVTSSFFFFYPFFFFTSSFCLFPTPYVSSPLSLGYPSHLTLFLSFSLVLS